MTEHTFDQAESAQITCDEATSLIRRQKLTDEDLTRVVKNLLQGNLTSAGTVTWLLRDVSIRVTNRQFREIVEPLVASHQPVPTFPNPGPWECENVLAWENEGGSAS